jgi:uncharacterized RDD family membrane protein YckC
METIDIRTTQNVTIEYELASLRERIIAFFIDGVIFGICYLVVFFSLLTTLQRAIFESGMLFYVVNVLLPVGGLMFYHLFSEILANGQSWGKKSMGIRVVRLDGQEPGLSDYLLRSIFLVVDALASLGVLGALLISSSPKNQRLGDMTANTTVIRMKHKLHFELEDILKIHSLADYQLKYPEVRKLSEKDMLLIKNTISRYSAYPNKAHKKVVNELVKRLTSILEIDEQPRNQIEFLKTLIRDYIVLTR